MTSDLLEWLELHWQQDARRMKLCVGMYDRAIGAWRYWGWKGVSE